MIGNPGMAGAVEKGKKKWNIMNWMPKITCDLIRELNHKIEKLQKIIVTVG